MADSTINLARAPRSAARWVARDSAQDSVALIDMFARNQRAYVIDHTATTVTARAIEAAIERAGAPERFVRLSMPGFNTRGDVAFVYGQFTCGAGCTWDEGFVLERRGTAWKVVARRRYSIS